MLVDDSEEDSEMEDDDLTIQKDGLTFEDLCGDASFYGEESVITDSEKGGWGLLDGHMLARVFHFLRFDLKSLVFASITCKHWRAAARFYRDISRHIDLSSLGLNCTDSIFLNIMVGFSFMELQDSWRLFLLLKLTPFFSSHLLFLLL